MFKDRKLRNTFLSVLFLHILISRVHAKKQVLIKVYEATSFGLKYVFFTLVLLQTSGAILELNVIHLCSVLSVQDCGQHQV